MNTKNTFLSTIVQQIRASSSNFHRTDSLPSKINIGDSIKELKYTLFLETSGCYKVRSEFSGCTMCGFACQIPPNRFVNQKDIIAQFENEIQNNITKFSKPISLRIYTNGSFFDNSEISSETREYILSKINENEKVFELVVESAANFINIDTLKTAKKYFPNKKMQINLGLETINDLYRNICINKGINLSEYINAIEIIKSFFNVGVYLLFKPPFLTESEAIDDLVLSIEKCKELKVDKIIINPSNVQTGTLLYHLWSNNDYTHPWIWSLIEVIKKIGIIDNVKFSGFSPSPTPIEMLKNCGHCDSQLLSILKNYPQINEILIPNCDCFENWQIEINKKKPHFNDRIYSEYTKLADNYTIDKKTAVDYLNGQLEM